MQFHEITVDNFMAPGRATLPLPERGVTVLSGLNGAGKSRFIEAASYGVWGRTLRDSDPWREGEPGSLRLETALGEISRRITAKGTKGVLWQGEKADTPSRTQELITATCGDFDYWRRTHVFSSSDAAHFSGATDGERKRVMEMLLGLDVFDRAAKRCLDELGLANAAHSEISWKLARAQERYNVACAELLGLGDYADFQPRTAPVEPPKPEPFDPERMAQLNEERRTLQRALEERVYPQFGQAIQQALVAVQRLEHQLDLAEAGSCTRCGQNWHGAPPAELKDTVDKARTVYAKAVTDAQLVTTELNQRAAAARAGLSRNDGEQRAAQAALEAAARRHATHDAWTRENAAWEAEELARRASWEQGAAEHARRVATAEAAAAEARDEKLDLNDSHQTTNALCQELKLASQVLGLRGLRSQVLGRALEGVEHVANYWLQQLDPKAALSLRADPETGKINLALAGYGGGKYKAASTGQRRRVDAPLLLALAEVAAAGSSAGRGTLFLDELFDGLDDEGQALVARALGELGERQSVVVVTHSRTLAEQIPAAQRFEVLEGQPLRRTL